MKGVRIWYSITKANGSKFRTQDLKYMRRELLIHRAKILALENTLTDTIAHSTAPSASRDLVVTLSSAL